MGMGADTKSDFVKRQIKNFSIGLQKMNPEIMLDPSVKYLRNYIFSLIIALFLITFKYKRRCVLVSVPKKKARLCRDRPDRIDLQATLNKTYTCTCVEK